MPCDIDETCNPLLLVPLQRTPLPDVTAIGMQTVDTVSTESSVVAQTPVVGRRVTKIARRRVTASTVVTRARARSDPRSSVRNPKRQSVNRTVPENESYVHPIPSASEDSLLSGSDDNDECTVYNLARQKATRSRAQSVVNAEPSKMRLNWKDGGMNQEHATFTGLAALNDELMQLLTPLQYFRYFFSDAIFGHIAQQTSLYDTQQFPLFVLFAILLRLYLGHTVV